MRRRTLITTLPWAGLALAAGPLAAAPAPQADPFGSLAWPDLAREHFGSAAVVFDRRVEVQVPAFAEDPMNVPVTVRVAPGLAEVEQILVIVDRNPIRKVLSYHPLGGRALPAVSFRFKLEQASPVRAAARTRDGVWHVGGALVDSAGGGCTVSGATRKDGSWSRTLGQVQGRVFSDEAGGSSRLRVRLMHPMDTGLVAGVPAFYINRLTVRDGEGRDLLRLEPYEPVSENPVFSFDFPEPPKGGLQIVGSDNNGNRIDSRIE